MFVLIGGTTAFAFWSFNQFNIALDDLNAPYLASTYASYQSLTRSRVDLVSTTTEETTGDTATTTDSVLSTTTPTISELSFIFPKNNTEVYAGCTYPIAWESPTTVGLLEAALVDAGTRIAVGPNTSGIAKESTIEKGSKNLSWKVGSVWPGAYYIQISKVNDTDIEFKSRVFLINKMPENADTNTQKNLCKESGGLI